MKIKDMIKDSGNVFARVFVALPDGRILEVKKIENHYIEQPGDELTAVDIETQGIDTEHITVLYVENEEK